MPDYELISAKYPATGEQTTAAPPELSARKCSRVNARRSSIFVVVFGASFVAWFFLLPLIQSALLPKQPGGEAGPWLIRPIIATRFCACAAVSVLPLPLLMMRFRKRRTAQDAAAGSQYDPFRDRPERKTAVMVKSCALLLIYAAALPFYLYSWTIVDPNQIELQSPLGRRHYTFAQIRSLQMIPAGMRSDNRHKNGPWYLVEFADGRNFDFSSANEGSLESEQSTIAKFIAQRSRQSWRLYPGIRPL